MVATYVASRGLDVKGIGHVVDMDLPRAFEDYVHRIGELGWKKSGVMGVDGLSRIRAVRLYG